MRKEKKELFMPKRTYEMSREMAKRSTVLLRNDNDILPLDFKTKNTLAAIGPLAFDKENVVGAWHAFADFDYTVSFYEALKDIHDGDVLHHKGCSFRGEDEDLKQIEEAVTVAQKADHVFLVVGEDLYMSGESASRTELGLPGKQELLVKKILDVVSQDKVTLIVGAGRPFDSISLGLINLFLNWYGCGL